MAFVLKVLSLLAITTPLLSLRIHARFDPDHMLKSDRWPTDKTWAWGNAGIQQWKESSGLHGVLDFPDSYDIDGKPCSFLTEYGTPARCGLEMTTWDLVNEYVFPNATVLELGARYGTTSCVISKRLHNSGQQVSVDPDYKVWTALESNLKAHNCNVNVLKGIVGKKDSDDEQQYDRIFNATDEQLKRLSVESSGGYGSQFGEESGHFVLTPLSLEHRYGLQFDTLVVDCELCFPKFVQTHVDFLQHVNTVILEVDIKNPEDSEYVETRHAMENLGFHLVEERTDTSWGWRGKHWVFSK